MLVILYLNNNKGSTTKWDNKSPVRNALLGEDIVLTLMRIKEIKKMMVKKLTLL